MESKLIGLTGGIGSGKSTVADFIEEAGYPVYNSDERARDIVNADPALRSEIIRILGEEAYTPEGYYNRKLVSEKVFNNDELLAEINGAIHPAVAKDFAEWQSKQTADFIFKETALLFELKLDRNCYKSILVTAEDNIRIKRTMDRDGKTYRHIDTVVQKQMPEKEKIKFADYVIYNNSDLESLRTATLRMLDDMRNDN